MFGNESQTIEIVPFTNKKTEISPDHSSLAQHRGKIRHLSWDLRSSHDSLL